MTLGLGFVDALLTTTGEALPRIPPLPGRAGIEHKRQLFSIRPEPVLANRRCRTSDPRTPPTGYAVVGLRAPYTTPTGGAIQQLSASVFNCGDQLYRNHSSFIEDLAPEIGRGVRLSYIVSFLSRADAARAG